MPSSSPVIAVVGSLNVDLVTRTSRVPSAGETLTAQSFDTGFGGKGANQAVACARLSRTQAQAAGKHGEDVEVRMIGALGDDEFAGGFLESLQKDGLNTSEIQKVADQKTGVAVIIVEEKTGENRIMFSPGANYHVPARNLVKDDTDLALFQLEIPLEVVMLNIREAKARGIDVMINPAPAVELPNEVFQGLNHLVLNESEAAILSGQTAESVDASSDLDAVASDFLRKGVRNLIITLGADGVYYQTADRHAQSLPGKRVHAQKVEVVDTTAAGDTFVGAYAVAVARSRSPSAKTTFDIDAAVEFANRAAALTVQRKGAQAAIPWLDEVPRS
ncbi:ribokinase-like protein [Saccharata proteae CBS 121410]|uniref:Ribokinase n=1 Tax=Saccharata proteae CBS 121410 TaxID=1314787 RepID=A0A9P4I059_9PEZI|nr:ribokinase-like protein [Saccharata proteae CBS 121410]